jgi:predicted aconitase with swiveling domain
MNPGIKIPFKCRKIAEGKAEGEAILSADAVCFYLVQPETGVIIEKNHSLEGQSIAGKVLVMPSGKGSSVVQADGLYKLMKHDKAPKGMIVEFPDPVLVSSAIIMEIPTVMKVAKEFYERIRPGDYIEIDADNEIVAIRGD